MIRLLIAALCAACMSSDLTAQDETYAESVAIAGVSNDGLTEVSIRLARFPHRGEGNIWVHLALNNKVYSVVDEAVSLEETAVTDIQANEVVFTGLGDNYAHFRSANRNGEQMTAEVEASTMMFADAHPDIGAGPIAIRFALTFIADDAGVRLNQRRWELTGEVRGEVHIGNEIVEISLPGKWHEQTGPRAQFAPAFTYFNIQNQDTALLAIHYPELGRTAGYLREGEQITGIKNLSISPPEHSERQFELLLEDQRQISGVANVTRRWSVPIEGQRRPGSTVVVDSSLGKLVGALNDWRPAND